MTVDDWRQRVERLEEVLSHTDRAIEVLSEQVRLAHDHVARVSERLSRLERRLGIVEAAWDRDNAPTPDATEPQSPDATDA